MAMARAAKPIPARMVPATDVVKTLQAVQDRDAARAREAARVPPYEWDLIVLVGHWMSTLLLIVAVIVLISLYQSRN